MVDSLARRRVLLLAALGFVEPSLAWLQARRGGGAGPVAPHVAGARRRRRRDARSGLRRSAEAAPGRLARELLPDRAQRLGGRGRVRAERPALQAYS
jgi:hypothetical protein